MDSTQAEPTTEYQKPILKRPTKWCQLMGQVRSMRLLEGLLMFGQFSMIKGFLGVSGSLSDHRQRIIAGMWLPCASLKSPSATS